MNDKLVWIAAPIHDLLRKGLESKGYTLIDDQNFERKSAIKTLNFCEGVITSTRLKMDREMIDAAPLLKWIGRMGSGMELIDVPYAESKGILVTSSPEGNSNAVAEHALGMLLNMIRRIGWSCNEVRAGQWLREENRGIELEGKTIGIIGFGNTGSAFAKKLSGFDASLLVYDKYRQEGFPSYVSVCQSLDPIWENADIISFHVPLQNDTHHYCNEAFIAKAKKSFILINTSRGEVAETKSIAAGLKNGKLRGVCLDVLEGEPLSALHPTDALLVAEMLTYSNAIITPHIAGYTHEAVEKMSQILLKKIVIDR
ncbi:MAG: hydroxyacid dehydrogenase [Bacteroidetes bacterium]|nr:hydroxyacid dehydrogenase [Bacteroidota bacterium]